MSNTALGITSPRSGALKKIDAAIQNYWKPKPPDQQDKAVSTIRLALNDWIKAKGKDWEKSERNRDPRYIVTELYKAVHEQSKFTKADLDAFKWQDEQRRLRIQKIFGGKRIVWQAFNAPQETSDALATVRLASKGNLTGHKADADAIKLIKEQQKQEKLDRQENGRGFKNSAIGAFNSTSYPAVGIANLVKNGVGQKAGEKAFGLAGTEHAPDAFRTMIHDLFGGRSSSGEISSHLMQTIGADIGKIGDSVIPIVSNVTSGAKLLIAWGKVGLAKYREYDTAKHGAYVAKGDMEAAFKSLELLLERKVTSETLQAGIQTADFTARTAMSFVDFGAVSGTMVGVISSLSKLVHKLYLLGREYSETRSARILLGNPADVDYTLFEAYPMLGCYMLLCSDLSEIIALSRAEAITAGVPFGGQGWMEDVEYLKRHHIDPILERASEFVYKSPFLVPNMPLHALYKPNVVDKAGTKYSRFQFVMNATKVGHKVISAAV